MPLYFTRGPYYKAIMAYLYLRKTLKFQLCTLSSKVCTLITIKHGSLMVVDFISWTTHAIGSFLLVSPLLVLMDPHFSQAQASQSPANSLLTSGSVVCLWARQSWLPWVQISAKDGRCEKLKNFCFEKIKKVFVLILSFVFERDLRPWSLFFVSMLQTIFIEIERKKEKLQRKRKN